MTNKYLTRLALPLLLLSAANAYGARIKSTLWEHPSVLTANDEHLQVQSVQLSDTATEVSIHVLQHNSGFTFSPRTYLLADDGKHYPIRRGKGIHLGKFIQCHAKDTVVTLVFDPVPRKTQSIDLIEGPGMNDFLILGIYDGKKPLQVKPRALDESQFDDLRRNFFHSATATLQGRVEGYDPKGERRAFTVYNNNVLINQSQPLSIDIEADGTFSQKIDLDYPIRNCAACQDIGKDFWFYIKPGQTLDVTLLQNGTTQVKDLSGHGYELNKLWDINPYSLTRGVLPYAKMEDEVKETSVAEFLQRMQTRAALSDSIVNYIAPRLGFNDYDYKFAMQESHIRLAEYYMTYFMYFDIFGNERKHKDDSLLVKTDTYRPITQWVNNDVLQLSSSDFTHLQNRYSFADNITHLAYRYRDKFSSDSARHEEDARLFGAASPSLLNQVDLLNILYRDYGQRVRLVNKDSIAEQKAVAAWEKKFSQRLGLLVIPFLREKAKQVFRNYIEQTHLAYDLPENEASEMFHRIADQYKGKYLFIDFWATSCGPCVQAIRNSLQMRKELHNNPNVKFIFITGDRQSPKEAYDKFVAQYLADEDVYRVPQIEFDKYMNLFQFSGIPHYEALDREGRVLRDYNEFGHFSRTSDFNNYLLDPLRSAYGEIDLEQIRKEREAAEALKHANDSLYVIHAVGKIKKTGKAIDSRFVLRDNDVENFLSQTKRYKSRTSYRGDDPNRPMSDNPRSKNGVVELEVECDEDGHISVN